MLSWVAEFRKLLGIAVTLTEVLHLPASRNPGHLRFPSMEKIRSISVGIDPSTIGTIFSAARQQNAP